MALGDLAKQIILDALSDNKLSRGKGSDQVDYVVETGLLDKSRSGGKVARLTFKFSTPIDEDVINRSSNKIFELISDSYDVEAEMDNLAAIFIKAFGAKTAASMGRQTNIRGSVKINLGDPVEDEEDGFKGVIQSTSGRFVSNSVMSASLELLAKQYLTAEMKRAGAPLKWRTGRFANSMHVKTLTVQTDDTRKNIEAVITYNYMTRPYSVFNPAISTYRGLSLRPFAGARNPQKLIGEALAKAAQDLIHRKYGIIIQEGTI